MKREVVKTSEVFKTSEVLAAWNSKIKRLSYFLPDSKFNTIVEQMVFIFRIEQFGQMIPENRLKEQLGFLACIVIKAK